MVKGRKGRKRFNRADIVVDRARDDSAYEKRVDKLFDGLKPTMNVGGKFVGNGVRLNSSTIGRRGRPMANIFGCASCNWISTSLCPHQSEVSLHKHHCNGICGQRIEIVKLIGNESGYSGVLPYAKAKRIKMFLDVETISDKLVRDALAKDDNEALQLALPWKRLGLEAIGGLIKQEEGIKVKEEKTITPVDLAKLIDDAKIVDAEVKDDMRNDDE